MLRSSSSGFVRRLAVVLAMTVSLGTLTLVTGMSVAHANSDESAFVSDINSARKSRGLRPLSVSSQLTSVARRWSQHMASGGCSGGASICHNPNLTSQVSGWQKIGENVGVGPSEDSVQDAFMNSSHHRANILDPDYTMVGVGTVRGSDGRLYVTQDFMKGQGSTSSGSTSTTTKRSSSTPTRKSSSGTTSRRSSYSSPTRSVPVLRPATPRPVASPLTIKLRTLKARGGASDPVGQALAYHSAMGLMAR